MKSYPDDVNAKINAIAQQESEKALEKTIKLSRRMIWIAVAISVVIPFGGYIYTRRWKALLFFFGIGVLCGTVISAGSSNEEEALERAFSIAPIIGSIAAPIDNGLAIQRARKKIQELTE